MNIKHLFFGAVLFAVSSTVWGQRFAVLSDVHITPGNTNQEKLQQAVAEINAGNFDAVIMNGDLTNEGSDAELANVKAILDGITKPLHVLPGNHENNWSQSATKTFVDLWGNDRFVAKYDSLVIVGINCGPYMKMGDGHIKQEDLHWLKETLQREVVPGTRVMSFNHYPLLDDLDNCVEYAEILQEFPVVAHVNGHYHSWRPYEAGGGENKGTIPCGMVRALDMKNGDYGYSIIEVSPDWVYFYNKEIGKPAEPKYAFAASEKHKSVAKSNVKEIVVPEGWQVQKVWADSASVFTRLGFDMQNVYFGNSLGNVRAVDKDELSLQWSLPTGASLFARPVALKKGNVAVPMHDGILVVDSKTGKVKGKQKSNEGPYVADGILTPDGNGYIQGGYKRIERRRSTDAKLIWVYDSLFNYCQAAPVVDGSDLIFGAWDTNLRCLDVKTGKLKWVWNNGKKANMLGPGNVVPVVTDDKVVIVAPDRYMTAVDRKTGKQIWRDNSHRYRESLGCSEDGNIVYAKTMDGELVAVDAKAPEFKELWVVDMGLGYEHAPCIVREVDGIVFAGSRRGILTMVDPNTRSVIASLPLGVSEINGIDLDPYSGDVYVSLIEGTIFRISKK